MPVSYGRVWRRRLFGAKAAVGLSLDSILDKSPEAGFLEWTQISIGNDYILLEPSEFTNNLTKERIRKICHRSYGIGSDGILYGPTNTNETVFALRIFNPDGSEAEKSGNRSV